jgi:1-acyl-sn-glycerol-3-phosphate acyltransferase
MRKIIHFLVACFGWKIDLNRPTHIKKGVVVMAPHTSNWDFVLGRLAFYTMGIKGRYLMKKEIFIFPLNIFLKALGAIPVDRHKNNNMVKQVATLFEKTDTLFVVFTPEGTRDFNPNWRKGFYFIAQEARVPILLSYIDFSTKTCGFHSLFEPTGNVDQDIQKIKEILSVYKGRFPEKGIIM